MSIQSSRCKVIMANANGTTDTDSSRLRSISTSTGSERNENTNCSFSMEDGDENDSIDVMMQGDDDNSIPTTMGVRASCMEVSNRNRSACHLRDRGDTYASNDNISVAENISSFFIPSTMPTGQAAAPSESTNASQHVNHDEQQMNLENNDCNDDISVLTEYSMAENEDDNLSQTTANTAWTGVTEVTNSTTAGAPATAHRPNFGTMEARKLSRRRRLANKRTRVQQSNETSNSLLTHENRTSRAANDQLKRRRRI